MEFYSKDASSNQANHVFKSGLISRPQNKDKNSENFLDSAQNTFLAQPMNLGEANRTPSDVSDRQRLSSKDAKHYSDNLYTILSDEINIKRRMSRNCSSSYNPILESLANIRKIQATKHVCRKYNNRKMEREMKFTVQNLDENLDSEDVFQSEGFSINIDNPQVLEFIIKELDDFDSEFNAEIPEEKKYSEKIEKEFEDIQFEIKLTEKEETKHIGSVRLVDDSYNIFDNNGAYLFQIDKIPFHHTEEHVPVMKKNIEGSVAIEAASVQIRPWNLLSLQSDIKFPAYCNPKEKLMILGVVLVLLMKMSSEGRELQQRHVRQHCSVGGIWRDMVEKMRSFFIE